MTKKSRVIIIGVVLIIVVTFFISIFNERGSTSGDIPDYEIVKVNDLSMGGIKRYSLHVVTKVLDSKQLKQVGISAIDNLKEKKTFNAVIVYINDYEEYINDGYSLGKIEYAPSGDWNKAGDVETGDYTEMEYKFDIRKKKSADQLTEFEVSITKQWYDTYYKMDKDPNIDVEENMVTESVARNNSIPSDEVEKILFKRINWMSN